MGYIQDDGLSPIAGYKMAMGGAPEGPKVPKNDENWVFLAIIHPGCPKFFYFFGNDNITYIQLQAEL